MKKRLSLILAVMILLSTMLTACTTTVPSGTSLSFADQLDNEMPKDQNYMFSPLSIKMALALSANGASGKTKREILNALDIKDLSEFNENAKELIELYSRTDNVNLNIANSIWINKDQTNQQFNPRFKDLASEYYHADVNTVSDADAVDEINGWVNDKTNGKIPKIINTAGFYASLLNATYFKGPWSDNFEEYATKPDTFQNADGSESTQDFMNKTEWLSFAETKSAKIVELPYEGVREYDELNNDFSVLLGASMYLILAPDDINAEQELTAAIEGEKFERTYVQLSVPKFKFEYETDLGSILKNLGIHTAFHEDANFKDMFDQGNMYFTDTVHKTCVSVDEKGTEAAAATMIMTLSASMPGKPIELKFNKPFHFIIRDNTNGETLFMGRYAVSN